jgi:hypothetical protein
MIAGVNLLPLIKTDNNGRAQVKTSPTTINIGGANSNLQPLGKRETVTIQMRDMPYNDALVDPYRSERPYNPLENGTFWSKWLARNPYYQGRNLRVLEGFVGQSLNQFKVRHYIIDTITQPGSNSTVTIKAFDILRKTDGDKAKYPEVISCRLNADVDEVQTTITAFGTASDFTVSDPIISYKAIRINDEVIEFGSVSDLGGGVIQFNNCVRNASGTAISSHSIDDDIFRCVDMEGKPWNVTAWLLKNPAKIPPGYIDESEWDDICNPWIGTRTVSRRLVESLDVNKMLSELTQQNLFYIWQDVYQQKINIKPFRLPDENAVTKINDTSNIREETYSESVDDKTSKTQIWIFFNQRDITEDLEKDINYKNTQVAFNGDIESENQRGESRIMKIYSAWIQNQTQAINLGYRMLARYSDAQRIATFEVDFKDDGLEIGSVLDLSHRNQVDFFGFQTEKRFEVISRETVIQGYRLKIQAQIYDYAGTVGLRYIRYSPNDYTPNYLDATQEERDTGYYYAGSNGKMSNGDDGYRRF